MASGAIIEKEGFHMNWAEFKAFFNIETKLIKKSQKPNFKPKAKISKDNKNGGALN